LDSKAIKMIVAFGLVATLLLTMMMMFTLDQVADTETPRIAEDAAREFEPSLAPGTEPAVRLTMTRDGKGPAARRIYKLRLRPNAGISADATTLASLMYHASEFCAGQIADAPSEAAIVCVAELADGGTKETTYMRDKSGTSPGLIREVAELPPLPADEAPKR